MSTCIQICIKVFFGIRWASFNPVNIDGDVIPYHFQIILQSGHHSLEILGSPASLCGLTNWAYSECAEQRRKSKHGFSKAEQSFFLHGMFQSDAHICPHY